MILAKEDLETDAVRYKITLYSITLYYLDKMTFHVDTILNLHFINDLVYLLNPTFTPPLPE